MENLTRHKTNTGIYVQLSFATNSNERSTWMSEWVSASVIIVICSSLYIAIILLIDSNETSRNFNWSTFFALLPQLIIVDVFYFFFTFGSPFLFFIFNEFHWKQNHFTIANAHISNRLFLEFAVNLCGAASVFAGHFTFYSKLKSLNEIV